MKKMMLLILVIATSFSFAQRINEPWCTMGQNQYPSDPLIKKIITNQITTNTYLEDPNEVIVIPVVFHVLYDPSKPDQHISESVINAQINRLNADFSMQNTSQVPQVWIPFVANMKFQFKLACIDPNGAPMVTPGIVYKPIPVNYEFCDAGQPNGILCGDAKLSALNGADAWPTDTYLNVWVFDMINSNLSGYSAFPWERFLPNITITIGGNPVSIPRSALDGIMLDYRAVGDPAQSAYHNRGKVLTHEVGHWLGLFHPYQQGFYNNQGFCSSPGDFVGDTPPQQYPTFNCPLFHLTDMCSSSYPGIMFMNFMDATQDDCMHFFTTGQKTRARSYFSSVFNGGEPETRYPFIENYFNIKHLQNNPHTVQNNTITIYITNPACLDVIYTFTGPVTLIQSNNKQVTFSVPCNTTGTVELTAKAGIPGMFYNYVDKYEFDFVNPTSCQPVWPKVYEWGMKAVGSLTKDNFGNIFYSFYSDNMQNNLNHNGTSSSNPSSFFTAQYGQSTGYTNWIKPDYHLSSGASLANSDIRLSVNSFPSPIFSHFHSTTGVPVSNTTTLTNTEIVRVETTSGEYLTYDLNSNVFRFHPTSGLPITLPYQIQTYFYSPFTSKLYTRSIHTNGTSGQAYVDVYDIANGTVTLAHSTIQTASWSFVNLDNAENLYVINTSTNNAYLEKYDYLTNTFTPLVINNFNNSNLITLPTPNYYPSDYLLVYNKNDNKLYSLNFNNNSVKSLTTSNIENFVTGGDLSGYVYVGNDLFLSGVIYDNQNIILGNQTISPLSANSSNHFNSNFLTKFNINTDFSFRQIFDSNVISRSVKVNSHTFDINLFPNPATNSLKINIVEFNKVNNPTYTVSIRNRLGHTLVKNKQYFPGNIIDILTFEKGLYFVEIINDKGERISKTLIKL